jgi:hypothetical protein
VSAIQALHHDGQTFLTWTAPPGEGWKFWVYRSATPIESSLDLGSAALLGKAPDSSWCDRRLSSLAGSVYGYVVDSAATPLDASQGLFVWTPDAAATCWYAVTCQAPGQGEDTDITPGANALALAVTETPAPPRPVYQRTLVNALATPADVYTLWAGTLDTPYARAMCNVPSEAWDSSIHHGANGGGLMFHAHVRGGSFYLAEVGSGQPGEWQITMDDYIRSPEANTFWFGFLEGYDIESSGPHPPPESGTVHDYTSRRVQYTLEWARRNFPVDTARVYVMGNSMGAIAGVFLAMWRPDLIAATMVDVPLFDFSFTDDLNPHCAFRTGGGQRVTCDRLWGEVPTGLLMEDGTPVYQRLNAGAMARALEAAWVPPIVAFSGRNDTLLGWSEKIPFYQAMRESRAGGTFFWDTRTHSNGATAGAWSPMEDYRYLYRFRTDLSFPALSNCSADFDPGDGNQAVGDSIGTINGFVEWDPEIVDQPDEWQVRLELRDLTSLWGVVAAPESVTVDVTPRRLQRFDPAAATYAWHVMRNRDGAIVQSGVAGRDERGVLTVHGVKVFRTGVVLALGPPSVVGVPRDAGSGAARLRIAPIPSPLRSACALAIDWPGAGDASIEILDVAGRRVRSESLGSIERGSRTTKLDPAGLGGGIYFLRARQGRAAAVSRFAVLR